MIVLRCAHCQYLNEWQSGFNLRHLRAIAADCPTAWRNVMLFVGESSILLCAYNAYKWGVRGFWGSLRFCKSDRIHLPAAAGCMRLPHPPALSFGSELAKLPKSSKMKLYRHGDSVIPYILRKSTPLPLTCCAALITMQSAAERVAEGRGRGGGNARTERRKEQALYGKHKCADIRRLRLTLGL